MVIHSDNIMLLYGQDLEHKCIVIYTTIGDTFAKKDWSEQRACAKLVNIVDTINTVI